MVVAHKSRKRQSRFSAAIRLDIQLMDGRRTAYQIRRFPTVGELNGVNKNVSLHHKPGQCKTMTAVSISRESGLDPAEQITSVGYQALVMTRLVADLTQATTRRWP